MRSLPRGRFRCRPSISFRCRIAFKVRSNMHSHKKAVKATAKKQKVEIPVLDPRIKELARRIAAAHLSLQMGIKMDYTLKKYISEDGIGELWIEMAKVVDGCYQASED